MSAGSNVPERLRDLGVRPSKRFGQNFLLNNTIAQNIVDAAAFAPDSRVIEIGPGLGALTDSLIQRYANFTAIEIEHNFCSGLRKTYPSLDVRNSDVLEISFKDFGEDLYVISNLPYSISTDVLLKLIYERASIKKAVLLLQREFAERFAGKPGGKQYGSLSVLGQLVYKAELGAIYQGGSFFPPADVESRVLILERKEIVPSDLELAAVEKILRASFGKRRKQILSSLSSGLNIPRETILARLIELGLKGTERPEELEVRIFLEISKSLLSL